MEVITIESQAFESLISKVNKIFDYVISYFPAKHK